MLKIGITGGIGSGKTIVCHVFSLLGIPVYDSDFRAKWVMQNHPALRKDLITAFGEKIYNLKGQLDRTYLAGLVFNNPERLTLLNRLVHPRVKDDFTDWCATAEKKAPYILKEAALMFESNAFKQVQKIITVSAPLNLRIKRVLQRDPHRKSAEIQAIIQKQLSEEERQSRADYIIYNDDLHLVIPQVLALHEQFLELATTL